MNMIKDTSFAFLNTAQRYSDVIPKCSAISRCVFVDAVQASGDGKLAGLCVQQWLSVWVVLLSVGVVLFIGFCMKEKHKRKTE
ncbi:MAG: hypothetical protein IJX91_00650 [Clostridia bacterium]|nr:hypothetical protein [Clostridia bacterium]